MSSDEIKKTYGIFNNPLNSRLISDLKRQGKEVLVFPLMKTKNLVLTETEIDFLSRPSQFDWIILTDVFAADYFIEGLRQQGTDFFELDNLTVCALGEAVADRLRFVQVHADVIPSTLNDRTVFSEISNFTGGALQKLRFLLVREKSLVFSFAENLINEKASVKSLPVYETEFDGGTEPVRLKTLLKGGAIDEFIFGAAEDVLSLRILFRGKDLAEILYEIQTSATTENAFLSLQENNLRPLYFHNK